jgi:hypothetical protein
MIKRGFEKLALFAERSFVEASLRQASRASPSTLLWHLQNAKQAKHLGKMGMCNSTV